MRMKRSWRQMIQPENQPDSLTSKQKDILWLADTHTHRTDRYNTVKAALKVCSCLEYAWPLTVLCRQSGLRKTIKDDVIESEMIFVVCCSTRK